MKSMKKKLLLTVLLMMLCVSSALTVQAASDKSKAISAYKKMLSARTMNWGPNKVKISTSGVKMSLAYIDNNSVPELLLMAGANNHVTGAFAVYTWKGGKVVRLANCRDGLAYYKKTGIFSTYTLLQGESEVFFRLSKGKAVQQASSYVGYGSSYTKGKAQTSISKSTFDKLMKSLTKGKKAAKITWRANTAANRKKYLK